MVIVIFYQIYWWLSCESEYFQDIQKYKYFEFVSLKLNKNVCEITTKINLCLENWIVKVFFFNKRLFDQWINFVLSILTGLCQVLFRNVIYSRLQTHVLVYFLLRWNFELVSSYCFNTFEVMKTWEMFVLDGWVRKQ